jgi:hypothetical protein
MIDLPAARFLAEQEIKHIGDIECVVTAVREEDFGWIFFYDSKQYIETDDYRYRLVGNAPIIVDRSDSSVHVTGTAYPIDYFIEEYRQKRHVQRE